MSMSMAIDRLEVERDIARRTLAFLDAKTTAMAPDVLEEPVEGYRSLEQFDLERRLMFNRLPMFVGLTCDLPDSGSWKTFDSTGTPILLVRDDDGRFRAFLNMCQHRGVKVMPSGCGEGQHRFTCPFHAWVYDLEGKLVGVPGATGFDGMQRDDRGLIELPAEEKYGMLFVAANPEASFSVDGYLGEELASHFESFHFERYKRLLDLHEHRIRTNWKVVWGTHCETYHFGHLHRATIGHLIHSNTSIADFFGDHGLMATTLKTIDQLRNLPEDQWYPLRDGHINLNYRLFPNLSLSLLASEFDERLEVYTPFPVGIDETVSLHYVYRSDIPTDEEELKQLRENVRYGCTSVADNEDFAVVETAEPGLLSPSTPKTFVFGRNEPLMQHMALSLRRTLGLPLSNTATHTT